eukprot:1038181-Amorphochlora_amoeboformis.AAC.1
MQERQIPNKLISLPPMPRFPTILSFRSIKASCICKEISFQLEQNARLARGLQQQHEEFKRKNLKILKQNQNVGQQ